MTPPSAMASKNIHAKAGPDAESAVQASKYFSSRNRHRPIELKMVDTRVCSTSSLFCAVVPLKEVGKFEITVMPSRIYIAGMVLIDNCVHVDVETDMPCKEYLASRAEHECLRGPSFAAER